MALRDGVLATKKKGYLNLEIEGDLKIVIDYYNKRINIPSYIMLLKEDIWKFIRAYIFMSIVMFIKKQIEMNIV